MSALGALDGRSRSLTAQLRLTERLFASSADRGMAARINAGLERVEEGILEQVAFHDAVADVRSRYLLAAGGKRVRPVLTLLTAQLGDGVTDAVVTAAQAVEILHVGSLYHDDVMDEASERRGVPSAQQVWGNSVAILTGDLLFARASKLIAAIDDSSAILGQAEVFERLVLGQLHETVGPQEGQDPVDHYLHVLEDKTGALIAAAAEWGASFSNAPVAYRKPLSTFGRRIGVAFQLIDDVIDLAPEEADTGKHAGTDLKAGVPTLPLLLLRRRAATEPVDRPLLARVEHLDAGTADEVAAVVAELRAHPVTAETRAEALRWAASAKAALDPLPDGTVKRALVRFADLLVDRSS